MPLLQKLIKFRLMVIRRFSADKSDSSHILNPSVFPKERYSLEIDNSNLPPLPEITDDTIDHLEQLSLVRFSNEMAVHHLKMATEYANQLHLIDTTGVEPMYTVLEDKMLTLRQDEVIETDLRQDILKNASKTMEQYFVAPPGNIPLEPRKDKLSLQEMKNISRLRNKF